MVALAEIGYTLRASVVSGRGHDNRVVCTSGATEWRRGLDLASAQVGRGTHNAQ